MYENIIEKFRECNSPKEVLDLITKAYKIGKENNENDHYLRVAKIISDLNADYEMVIASMLYDAVNNDKLSIDDIKIIFDENIANLVNNLLKIQKLKLTDYTESSSIYLRKILVGVSEDVRVLIIKLADRLDEMRNCELTEIEKKQIANETENVLIPIAHRLGINTIKSELEDLCLKFLKPDVYNEILEKLSFTRKDLQDSLDEMRNEIIELLSENGISFQIKSRVKSVYSIYNKLSTGRKWSDIYDILAMRLILPTVDDCYLVVGLIHAKYRPIAKRFKDYIAMPKENMYQSLHTSVYGIDGHIFEIQLRTKEMNEIAEHGIASHWSYKEHGTKTTQNMMEQKLEVFRNTIDAAKKEANDEQFNETIENELLSKSIYVYTPKGDVMELPKDSTPIDFAYRIHSKVGDTTVGAIVNDQIVPLDYKLQDGDSIKINTNPNAKPNIDWIKFIKTTQAKNKIKAYFSKQDHDRYIETGKELLEKEIRKQKLSFNEILSDINKDKLIKELKFKDMDDLYLSIGSLRYTPTYIINLITEEKADIGDIMLDRVNRGQINEENYHNEIIVSGTDNIKASLAKCCSPIPGDEIIGYITKGDGIIVHKKSCSNIKEVTNRLIEVSWNTNSSDRLFITNLLIKTNEADSHLVDIVTKASTRNISIISFNEIKDGYNLNYKIVIKAHHKDELKLFINDLLSLSFINEVIR